MFVTKPVVAPHPHPLPIRTGRGGFRAVVFDLDGTLCDSAPDIAEALNATLEASGLGASDLAKVKTMVGGGAGLLIERALRAHGETPSRTRIEMMLADFLERYRAEPCRLTRLYPGAAEMLQDLSARGIPLGICTNKPAELTGLVLKGLGIGGYFASVVPAIPSLPPKPAPDMLVRVLKDLGVEPASALMVGDSAADLGTARAASVACVLLSHGYSREPVERLGPDCVMAGFAQLSTALRSICLHSNGALRIE